MWAAQFENIKDVDALGLFIDNHDNNRFLYNVPQDQYWRLNNALAFIFNVRGIPTVYYGTEQGFNSAGDPWCRQPLWPTKYDKTVDFYKYIAALNKNRSTMAISGTAFNEIVVADTLYAFTRGPVFVITRNAATPITQQKFTFLDADKKPIYTEGQQLVNWQDEKDIVTVDKDNSVTIDIKDGYPVIYNLKSQSGEVKSEDRNDIKQDEVKIDFTIGL